MKLSLQYFWINSWIWKLARIFPKCFGKFWAPFSILQILYNFLEQPNQLKKLKEMKKDDTVRNLLASKFDREE
jgi:hypothetical protein